MSHGSGHPTGYEKKDIDIKKVTTYALLTVVLLIIMLLILDQWFIKTKEDIYQEMVLDPINMELSQIRAREDSLLNVYGRDDSTGTYRIPIDSAIALTAAEYQANSTKK